jgi:hypothetical protein
VDVALEVIGAGFGRTGTESMKQALERLGFGPTHHMTEVLESPEQIALWRAIAAGAPADWDIAFAGYRSAVDWPSAFFWRELADHYPGAKVLLTLRSAESWYESFSNTILPFLGPDESPEAIGPKLIGERVFGGRAGDRAHAIAVYERNTADVEAAFPPERLLTFRLGDGWEPLCRFLGVPAPNEPFPRTNSTEAFRQAFANRRTEAAGET